MARKMNHKLYRMPKGYDKVLHYTVMVLAIFGVIMQTSASMDSTSLTPFSLIIRAVKHTGFLVINYFAMNFLANYFNLKFVLAHAFEIVVGMAAVLACTMLGPTIGGANAWIVIPLPVLGAISLQPSEFAKIVMIVLMAVYLGLIHHKNWTWQDYFKSPFVVFLVYFGYILFFQHDFGTALILMLITAICVVVPSNPQFKQGQRLVVLLLIVFVCLMLFLMSDTGLAILSHIPVLKYQVVRFQAANNPFANRYGAGFYDLVNSLIAFNTGGLFGVGLGKSLRKYGYISAASSDFIMAVVVEEIGIIGFLFVFLGYLLILYRLLKVALKAENDADKILVIGVMMYFLLHFIFNIGGVTCLIPLTGIPLLLISSGGTSGMAAMGAIGIVQSIIVKQKKVVSFALDEEQ